MFKDGLGLGRTLEDVGDAANALACYRNVLAHCPDHALALGQYFALLKEPAPEELLTNAKEVLDDASVNDEARALIGYGLAKYYDRRAEYSDAATVGRTANACRRRAAGPLDRAALTARIDGIIATYDEEFFFQRRHFGLGTDQPVFIVGLPRSGTTLCEQILSSHPMLHGSGELSEPRAWRLLRWTEQRFRPGMQPRVFRSCEAATLNAISARTA